MTQGKVILKSIPNQQVKNNILSFLQKRLPKLSPTQIEARLQKLPLVLTNNIDQEKGQKLVEILQRLGGEAVFLTSSLSQTITKPPKELPRELPQKSKSASSKKTAVSFLNIFFLIMLVVVIIGAGLWFTDSPLITNYLEEWNKSAQISQAIQKPLVQTIKTSNQGSQRLAQHIDSFELKHPIPHDKRLVEGLELAFQHYIQFFEPTLSKNFSLKTNHKILDLLQHEITFNLQVGEQTKTYQLVLSNAIDQTVENLSKSSQIFNTFVKDFGKQILLPVASDTTPRFMTASNKLTHQAFFSALHNVEQKAIKNQLDNLDFFNLSEAFAWQAFLSHFKAEINDLNDLLVNEAVAYYLIGSAFNSEEIPYYKGLLFTALDYPQLAIDFLKQVETNLPHAELLNHYLKMDIDFLKEASKNTKYNKRLSLQLLSAAYIEKVQYSQSEFVQKDLLELYPDFLQAIAHIARHGSVGMERLATPLYLAGTFKAHITLIYQYLDLSDTEKLKDLAAILKLSENGEEQVELEWLATYKQVIEKQAEFKNSQAVVLTGNFLKNFLQADMNNAILAWFHLESFTLGRKDRASKIVKAVVNAYPDSSLYHYLNISDLLKNKDYPLLIKYLNGLDVSKADKKLALKMLGAYSHWWQDAHKRPKLLQLIEYAEKFVNPNASGSHQLYNIYYSLRYMEKSKYFLTREMTFNPYIHNYHYISLANIDNSEHFIQQGLQYLDKDYYFLISAAKWYQTRNKKEQAIELYEKAIKEFQTESLAYKEFGLFYKKINEPEKALSIWRNYLDYDNQTLNGVVIRNNMTKLYLETQQYQKAYDISKIAKESWQEEALLLYAKANEKLNNLKEAEEYFKNAAERYSNGTELALFYLTQNQLEKTVEILRKYKTKNSPYYYFKELAEYAIEQNNPDIVTKVFWATEESNAENKIKFRELVNHYAKKKLYAQAANLLEPLATSPNDPRENYQHLFAGEYFDYSVKSKLKTETQVTEELLKIYERFNPAIIGYSILSLLSKGYFIPAQKFTYKLLEISPTRNREAYLTILGVIWQTTGKQPADKTILKKLIVEQPLSDWAKTKFAFLLDEIDENTLFTEANNPDRECEVHYYLGFIKAQNPALKQEAMRHFLISLETKALKNMEYEYALEWLIKLSENKLNSD